MFAVDTLCHSVGGGGDHHQGQDSSSMMSMKIERKHTVAELLPTENIMSRAKHDFKTPLHHLKGRETVRYHDPKNRPNTSFANALELFNRRSVRKLNRPHPERLVSEMCEYFFESVGKVKVTFKSCIGCRDKDKSWNAFDEYYMDLLEISQQRTILCSTCMNELIRKNLHCKSACEVNEELKKLRDIQCNGVYIDPFLKSCGY